MSPSISPHNLSKFNMDWFTVNGSYATLKKGCVNTFFNTLDEMHKAQESVCAQARECLVDDLTQEQIDYLSSAYDPESMSYSEYRSFLDDLCSFGYFAEEDKPYVSCGVDSGNLMMIPVSYYPRCDAALSTASFAPGSIDSFPSDNGDVLAWAKSLSSFGTYNPISKAFEKTNKALLFERLQNVFLKMKN
ncbi:MAG: hypothetical protein HFF83_06040 [Oscillibacter sp.]|jgi:hypothetical protein|nr:hypothetical protein [Oscillibacter sp.]